MRNPLIKRLPRELLSEITKYLVIFIFMTGTIGFISGFLVAGDSLKKSYDESFEKYNIEDGNFELLNKADENLINTLEEQDLKIYNNNYIEEDSVNDSVIRLFLNREDVNKVCVIKGKLPNSEKEIAIDRMYANNNNISVGQKQRIAIARSILKDTPIILFDEVTSALDKESKKNIEETINEIAKVKTVVVIAHTLDSIDNFDNIVCLKNGVIVEEGSHNDLINEKGMYYNLLNI